jgi:hypothetical protein
MPSQSPDDLVLMPPEEAAKLLNSFPKTLERWRYEGNGPRYVKVGHRVYYRREAINDWILKQERASTSKESSKARRSIRGTPDGAVPAAVQE